MSDEISEDGGVMDGAGFPGAPLRDFQAAIETLKSLRDQGKYTVMVGRLGSVRLVGVMQEFRQSFIDKLQREADAQQIESVVLEIKRFCQATLFFEDVDRALRFLETNIYDDEFKKLDESEREQARGAIRHKLVLARDLLPPAAKQRRRRLRTATDACLEDLDVEVVKLRHDDLQGVTVEQPFLRLRIRYSDASAMEGFPFGILAGPFGESPFATHKSFALEVDEVDIDVLLFRLRQAKELLSSAVEASTSRQ
jgi:hypothetical protein